VLAHEFGHLAGGHGKVSQRIYRLRLGWIRLAQALDARRPFGGFAFRPFRHWYAPYFSAWSFPLARADEYEADRASARLTSPRAAAEALTTTKVVGRFLATEYWPAVLRRADDTPQPSFTPHTSLSAALGGLDPAATRLWLDEALAVKTTTADTHPALAERLQALGEGPQLALRRPEEAADSLLGDARERIVAELDTLWQKGIAAAWAERHREVRTARVRLADLDARAAAGDLPPAEALERAQLTEAHGAGADAALAQLEALHARQPEDAAVGFVLGRILLKRDEARGIALLERAMQREADAVLPGAEILRDHHWRQGRQDEARRWHRVASERAQLLEAARAERTLLRTSDRFEPHGLQEAAIAELRRQLAAVPGVRRAYFVRKRVATLPQQPLYVLCFLASPWWKLHRQAQRYFR
jgi:hypothetical protein